jgi:hypothetical protein
MTQRRIDRLVARKTGERLSTIRNLGFQLHRPDFDDAETHDDAIARLVRAYEEQHPDSPSA